MKIVNAFSVTMLPGDSCIKFKEIRSDVAALFAQALPTQSAVGHEGTAKIFSAILGKDIPANRIPVQILPGEKVLLGSISGRLPEGKVLSYEELKDISIKWYLVSICECKEK